MLPGRTVTVTWPARPQQLVLGIGQISKTPIKNGKLQITIGYQLSPCRKKKKAKKYARWLFHCDFLLARRGADNLLADVIQSPTTSIPW
jgi:hypothetical protein